MLCSFLILLAIIVTPQAGFAHASLVDANPTPDSQLSSSPEEIQLTFSERLEDQLYSIVVYDSDSRSVTERKASMSKNHKEIFLDLPDLEEGVYTVTYKVISADGHPVRDSYVFTIGSIASEAGGITSPHGISHQQHSGMSEWTVRIVYYITLLAMTGFVSWGVLYRFKSEQTRQQFLHWSSLLQKFFLVLILGLAFIQCTSLLNGSSMKEFLPLILKTSVGISHLSMLCLSLLGFLLLHRSKWLDGLWVILLFTAKSINGHAFAFETPILTAALNVIHLLAAALWVGGLFIIILLWRKEREEISFFLLRFSPVAMTSILVLVVSGTISTILILAKLSYLFDTWWGKLLILKVTLVLLVIVVGALIRFFLKKRKSLHVNRLVKIDFSFMLAIIVIVGIFTTLSPLPPNEPFYWHEMGNIHMTTTISPNSPGVTNTFNVDVWVGKEEHQPKYVKLFLTYKDNVDIAPIEVPLFSAELTNLGSSGFTVLKQYGFTAQGPYLPFSGTWNVEVRIMDAEDNETVYNKELRI